MRSYVRSRRAVGAIVAFGVVTAVSAWAQYEVSWWSVDGGGGMSSNASCIVRDAIGQPDAFTVTNASSEIDGGFLAVPSSYEGVVVTDLDRPGYEVGILDAAQLVYADRSYTFIEPVPNGLRGQTYIRTLNDEKDTTTNPFLSFRVYIPVSVGVAFEQRINPAPSWASDWTATSLRLYTDDVVPERIVYYKNFPAGTIVLGPNRDSGMSPDPSMYTVVVIPFVTDARDWMLFE
ncbi:hypothetical protein JW916_10065 [Candidatus Sumerlaeota bacterium]|nr:hypothetical protein [Candidatus Sumerlaeota bacterium]